MIESMRNCLLILWLAGMAACNSPANENPSGRNGQPDSLSEEQLLDSVQYRTFQYFWEGAEPNSGLARERYHVDGVYPQKDKHVVTSGGAGVGMMAILVGIVRGFITREAGCERSLQMGYFIEEPQCV